jgi:hypothetical protein
VVGRRVKRSGTARDPSTIEAFARSGQCPSRRSRTARSRARNSTRARPRPLVRDVLETQRGAIIGLRDGGEMSDDVMHRPEHELDLEDQRLEI